MKNRIFPSVIAFAIVLLPLTLKQSRSIYTKISVLESEATPVHVVIGGAYVAYRLFRAAKKIYDVAKKVEKASEKVKRARRKMEAAKRKLAKQCNRLGELYQSFKGAFKCVDSCRPIPLGRGKRSCYAKMRQHAQKQIDQMKDERKGRIFYERLCSGSGVVRRKSSSTGRRKGKRVQKNKGHELQIEALDGAIKNCVDFLKRGYRLRPRTQSDPSIAL